MVCCEVYWIAVQFVRVQASSKSGFIFQLGVFDAVTENKWFGVNKKLAPSMLFLSKIIFPFKDPQNWYFSQKIPVAQG